jgi:hypothetical protein
MENVMEGLDTVAQLLRNNERKLINKMERKKWIGGMPDMVTQFEPLGFFIPLLREVWGLPQG